MLEGNMGLEIVAIHPNSENIPHHLVPSAPHSHELSMQTLHVNGYDMAYLDVGQARDDRPPLVCVHGSLCDFRIWSVVLGPLTRAHRVIAVSLRHFFPEHWDGVGDTYSIAQHVVDMIAFIEKLEIVLEFLGSS